MTASRSLGTIDPELLRARVGAIEDQALVAEVTGIVDHAIKGLTTVQGINFACLERDIAGNKPSELWESASGSVSELWAAVEGLQQAMLPLTDAYQAVVDERERIKEEEQGDDLDILAFDVVEPSGGGKTKGIQERISETAWSMSFVLKNEIDSFRGRLPTLVSVADGWELVSSLQDHVGHLRGALNAIVAGIFTSLPIVLGEQAADEEVSLELTVARELRSRIFGLRDAVLEVEREMDTTRPDAWRPALGRAHKLLKAFIFGPGFAWMRAGDKRAFLNHQRQLDELLALWSALRATPAKQLIGSFARHLEALEVINQRECLVAHDRDALRRAIDNLQRASKTNDADARTAVGRAVAALAEAQGRDKVLDELLAKTLDPVSPVPAIDLQARAIEILTGLGG